MATIKSFSDLQQSKTLAKILPLESADMHYNNGSCRGVDYTEHFNAELMPYQEALHLMKIHKTNFMFQVIPCWSLAALLDAIPTIIGSILEKDALRLRIDKSEADFNIWYDNLDTGMVEEGFDIIKTNPVDACYEMILKLNEFKCYDYGNKI